MLLSVSGSSSGSNKAQSTRVSTSWCVPLGVSAGQFMPDGLCNSLGATAIFQNQDGTPTPCSIGVQSRDDGGQER